MLQISEQENILKFFPKIEMCFEPIIHNTFSSKYAYVIAVPEGKKCFAWFTTYNNQNVCFLVDLSKNKLEIVQTCFHKKLAQDTVLYGTKFTSSGKKYFSCEDIYYYKGHVVSYCCYATKLAMFKNIFTHELKQVSYFNNMMIFGLPVISASLDNLQQKIKLLPYPIKHVQYIIEENSVEEVSLAKAVEEVSLAKAVKSVKEQKYLNTNTNKIVIKPLILINKASVKTKVFRVKADIQNDIYNLYLDKPSEDFFGLAYIPDYKTSVLMNKLFRNIKENQNLDALEESDDEAEFEDEREDKYVYLDRCHLMECEYNMRFKKWQPVRIAN